jgi:S-adenosylmethionine-diacylglycerol 3-amino-3-carboxypropyl transferase
MASSETRALVNEAVYGHQDRPKASLLDRLFARVFSGLVYTQIWEDPFIDLEAMALESHHHVVTISSAGCNALNYLMAGPAHVDVVDLNGAHLSLLELKMAAIANMSDHQAFEAFFAEAASRQNVEVYDRVLRWSISTSGRVYWNGKAGGKRRIDMFANGFYRHGLLGQFIRLMRLYAKFHGVKLDDWTRCKTREEQIAWFDRSAPRLFNGRLVQLICRSPVILYQLGIPPRQFNELCDGKPETMADVLRERARALLTTGTVDENYFAWQATTGHYRPGGPYPPYLRPENFETLRGRIDRIALHQKGVRQYLQTMPDASVDRVVLLDAQDWMDNAEVARLWTEITRTARPGARVIFRTAGLTWRAFSALPLDIASSWETDDRVNLEMTSRDMSGIYGRFHLYRLRQKS